MKRLGFGCGGLQRSERTFVAVSPRIGGNCLKARKLSPNPQRPLRVSAKASGGCRNHCHRCDRWIGPNQSGESATPFCRESQAGFLARSPFRDFGAMQIFKYGLWNDGVGCNTYPWIVAAPDFIVPEFFQRAAADYPAPERLPARQKRSQSIRTPPVDPQGSPSAPTCSAASS